MPLSLADLRSHVLRVRDTDGALTISPGSRLTPELRTQIRAGKAALLAELAAEREALAPFTASLKVGTIVVCGRCLRCVVNPETHPDAWCRRFEEPTCQAIPFTCGGYEPQRGDPGSE